MSERGTPEGDYTDQPGDEDVPADHDVEALRTTQSEVRAVLDHQIQTFNDVDNKAARTFRLNAILLGLILTAVSFVVRSQSFDLGPFANWLTIGGVVSLIVSFVSAVITYTTTEIRTGLGPDSVQRLIDHRYSEKEWLILLLRSEAHWMRVNERQQTINGLLLSIAHATLIIAVLLISIGIASVHSPF